LRRGRWKSRRKASDWSGKAKRRRGWWPFRHAMSPKQKAIEVRKIQEKAKALQRERDDDRAAF